MVGKRLAALMSWFSELIAIRYRRVPSAAGQRHPREPIERPCQSRWNGGKASVRLGMTDGRSVADVLSFSAAGIVFPDLELLQIQGAS